MEARECLSGKDPGRLTELLQKQIHRDFVIDIFDKELHRAIQECNLGLGAIKSALNQGSRHQLVMAHGHMSGKLVDLWNATTEYEKCERAKDEREWKFFKRLLLIVAIVFSLAPFALFLIKRFLCGG